jgi:chitodextrinase
LSASATSCSQISLSWGASSDTGGSGLKGYNIYRNGSYLKQALTTSTSDTGLAASTVYSYAVSAIDNAGNEVRVHGCNKHSGCPDVTPPSVSTNPPSGAAYDCATVTIAAASDNVGVTVEFYDGSTLMGTARVTKLQYS